MRSPPSSRLRGRRADPVSTVRTGVLAGTLALLLAAGCRTADPLDAPFAGRTAAYAKGRLSLDIEAFPDSAGVTIWVGIPPATLVFEEGRGAFAARYTLDIELRDEDTGALIDEQHVRDTLRALSFDGTRTYRAHLTHHRLTALPGVYVAEVVARDEEGGGEAARQRVRVTIPEPGTFTISPVRLGARLRGDTLRPLVSLYAPARLDTLRASVTCSDVPAGTEAVVVLRVLAFETDTLAAEVPYGYGGIGSLAYRGVRTERADTLQASRQPLRGAADEVTVEFGLPRLAPGLYRIEIDIEGLEKPAERTRVLAVQPPDFPRIATLGEMVEALGYLLTRREARAIRKAETPEAMREAFDTFWGRAAPNREAAAALMRRYYARVEEANLRFSAFKPGWKTDRGMVYVVLGAPLHVETWPDREEWHYSFDDGDATRTYVFQRVRMADADTPFVHYVLDRSNVYQRLWQRAIEKWRAGEAR